MPLLFVCLIVSVWGPDAISLDAICSVRTSGFMDGVYFARHVQNGRRDKGVSEMELGHIL